MYCQGSNLADLSSLGLGFCYNMAWGIKPGLLPSVCYLQDKLILSSRQGCVTVRIRKICLLFSGNLIQNGLILVLGIEPGCCVLLMTEFTI
jgi:hypothetical protein